MRTSQEVLCGDCLCCNSASISSGYNFVRCRGSNLLSLAEWVVFKYEGHQSD